MPVMIALYMKECHVCSACVQADLGWKRNRTKTLKAKDSENQGRRATVAAELRQRLGLKNGRDKFMNADGIFTPGCMHACLWFLVRVDMECRVPLGRQCENT